MSIETTLVDLSSPFENSITYVKKPSPYQRAMADLRAGFKKWNVWLLLAYQDVKLRYRRSVLGPFWITLSMAITVYSMGYLYGHLFHTDLQVYFPFLVAGMLGWALISSQISDLTEALTVSESLIKQIKLPYSLYIHRVAMRNIIIFFHNIIVIVPILALYHQVAKVDLYTLMLIPGLLLIYINSICYGLILGMLGARYRDIIQIVRSLIQVAFFLTPIMWNPSLLPEKDRYLVLFNPFYSFVELIRAPLLGAQPEWSTFAITGLVTLIGLILCLKMFSKYRARIVYWL